MTPEGYSKRRKLKETSKKKNLRGLWLKEGDQNTKFCPTKWPTSTKEMHG